MFCGVAVCPRASSSVDTDDWRRWCCDLGAGGMEADRSVCEKAALFAIV